MYIFLKGDELTKIHQYDPNSADGRMYAKKGKVLQFVRSNDILKVKYIQSIRKTLADIVKIR